MPLTYNSPEAIYVQQYCNKYFPDVDFEDGEPYLLPSGELDIFLAKYDPLSPPSLKTSTKGHSTTLQTYSNAVEKYKTGERMLFILTPTNRSMKNK